MDFDVFRFHLTNPVGCPGSESMFFNIPSPLAVGNFSKAPSIVSCDWNINYRNIYLKVTFDMPIYFPILSNYANQSIYTKEIIDQIVRVEQNISIGQKYNGYFADGDKSFVIYMPDLPQTSELYESPNSINLRFITPITNWRGTSRPITQLLSPSPKGKLKATPGIQQVLALSSTGQFGNLTTSDDLRSNIFDSMVIVFTNSLSVFSTDRYISDSALGFTCNVNLGQERRFIWLGPNILWIDLSGVTLSWMTSPKNLLVRFNMTVYATDLPSFTVTSIDNSGIAPMAYPVNPNGNPMILLYKTKLDKFCF